MAGDVRLAGAIDIGATGTKIGIVGEDGRIASRATIATAATGAPLVEAIAATLQPLLDAAGESGMRTHGVGVSVAGFLDRARAVMVLNANLPGLRDFPLRRALEERLGLDCRLDVDSNAAVAADYRFGGGRGSARLLGVTVG